MSSKVKGSKVTSSGRKKEQSISESTPTTSTVLLPQQQSVPEKSSVDDVLKGEDIAALHIHQEQLSKLHPQVPPSAEKKLKKVVVKKTLNYKAVAGQGHRHVAVLHPLPHPPPITDVRILGSPKPGPRFDSTNTFIPHSVLAPSESYAASLYHSQEMTRPPPVVLPEVQSIETGEEMTYQSTIMPKEAHALDQWNRVTEDRRLQQNIISRKIFSTPNQLAMNQGDGFRSIQEERTIIDHTLHLMEKGNHVGSEFWHQQVSIGDENTGIRTTLTQTEKGLPSELEFVGTPRSVQKEKGPAGSVDCYVPLYHSWRRSAYLAERHSQIQSVLQENKNKIFNPDIAGLEVIGQSPWRKQHKRADSLGSDDDDDDDDDDEVATRDDSMYSTEKADERPESVLDLQPIVHDLPIVGPALRIGDVLIKWEGLSDAQQEPLEFRVLFEGGLDEMVTSYLQLENCGTTAIYYSWQCMPKANPHSVLRDNTQRFYFDTRGDVLLPGQSFPLPFVFKSPNAGVFSETWSLQTGPVLAMGKPLVFVLRGIAFQEDLNIEKRNAIEAMLARHMAADAAEALIKRLVDSICTPPHTPPPMERYEMEEDVFISKNHGLFYHHNLVHKLKVIYDTITSPVSIEEEVLSDTKGAKKVETKVPTKDKKETEGKRGKQPTVKVEDVEGTQVIQETLSDERTGWDLSMSSLQEAILQINDDVIRDEKLKEMNVIVGDLSFPPANHPKARHHSLGYQVLCEAIDNMVAMSAHLSHVMGVPLKEFSSGKSSEPEQVDSVPSSPVQSSKKDKKGTKEVKKPADKQKSKDKEKVTAATTGKAKPIPIGARKSKANVKDIDKPEGEVEGPNAPVETDPIVLKKYKDALYTVVYEILGSAVDKMVMLFEDV